MKVKPQEEGRDIVMLYARGFYFDEISEMDYLPPNSLQVLSNSTSLDNSGTAVVLYMGSHENPYGRVAKCRHTEQSGGQIGQDDCLCDMSIRHYRNFSLSEPTPRRPGRGSQTAGDAIDGLFRRWDDRYRPAPSIEEFRSDANYATSSADIGSWWKYCAVRDNVWDDRGPVLFSTRAGFAGLGRAGLTLASSPFEKNPVVALLYGCKVPMILIPHGSNYRFHGFAYLHGIMSNELMLLCARCKLEE